MSVVSRPEDGAALCLNDQEEEPPSCISSFFAQAFAAAGVSAPAVFDASAHPVTRRVMRMNPKARAFRRVFFHEATDLEWADWRWQLRNRITTSDQIRRMISLSTEEEKALESSSGLLPAAITPHYMALVSPHDPEQPMRRMVIPTVYELRRCPGESDDPLGEDHQSPVHGVIHRYPDRALLLATDFCSTYCRYCTRSRVVGQGDLAPTTERLLGAFDYIRRTPAIRDVLISGGDPLTLSDNRLEWILSSLRTIPHVQIIRLGTKIPAVLPQRVTPQLARMLRKYHPVWMSLHFAHPDECCYETERACGLLADAGIPLGSQTVLLNGINDSIDIMKALMHGVMRMRVRPYYIYQCDPISGSRHFRTPVSKGIEIIRGLRGHTSGYAVPSYVIDAPGGGGKIPITPDYVVGREGDDLLIRNHDGNTYRYPDCVAS